jgi:hypothetical protein
MESNEEREEKKIQVREWLKEEFSKSTLAQSSIKQHITKILKWIHYVSLSSIDTSNYIPIVVGIDYIVGNPKESLSILNMAGDMVHSPENHATFIGAIMAYLRHIKKDELREKEWKEIRVENDKPMQKRRDDGKPTKQQENKVLRYELIEERRDALEKGSMERLLLSIYTLLPPLRADHYATRIIHPEDNKYYEDSDESSEDEKEEESTKENVIIKTSDDEWDVIVKNYKTNKRYGTLTNKIKGELLENLKISLEKHPREYLFVNPTTNDKFTRTGFSEWSTKTLTKGLKHDMTLTVLRHLYIQEKEKTLSGEQMTETAKQMGHSRDMQRAYVWK